MHAHLRGPNNLFNLYQIINKPWFPFLSIWNSQSTPRYEYYSCRLYSKRKVEGFYFIELKEFGSSRGPGTNYSIISHESNIERSSVIWQWMLLIGWYCWSKTILSSRCKNFFFSNWCVVYYQVHLYCVCLDQKVKIVISILNQDKVFPKYGCHYKSRWRSVFFFLFPLFMLWLELKAYGDAPHVLWDTK